MEFRKVLAQAPSFVIYIYLFTVKSYDELIGVGDGTVNLNYDNEYKKLPTKANLNKYKTTLLQS